jgi:hypothetical protein
MAFPQFFNEYQQQRARSQVLANPEYYGNVTAWAKAN